VAISALAQSRGLILNLRSQKEQYEDWSYVIPKNREVKYIA